MLSDLVQENAFLFINFTYNTLNYYVGLVPDEAIFDNISLVRISVMHLDLRLRAVCYADGLPNRQCREQAWIKQLMALPGVAQ